MDYRSAAKEVLQYIGGTENIVSAAHCATRLRLVIADNSKVQKEKLENIEGVKGTFEASGQLQVIFGTGTVNKVYDEMMDLGHITGATKEEVKQTAAAKQNPFKRAINTLGDIFVPIIPAIVASGLLMGLLEGLCNVWPAMAESGTYTIIHLFSNAAFVYLPILIAISAAKAFGGNLFLGAVIGMIMIHSDLLNAWSVSGMNAADIPTASAWFGLYDINLVGYQGHVIPVIIDLFVTPLCTVLVTGYVTLTVIGPVFSTVENWVLAAAAALITIPFGLGSAFAGAFYAPTVVAGLHHMYNALEAGLLSQSGVNTWMPIATAPNVAQGAAALAVAVKTGNNKTKALALPASLSAFLGITEPAIFGVNIRYMTPFVAGCVGGAAGGLLAGIFGIGATAYGITGIFGFLITTRYAMWYAIEMLVAAGVAFAISWILFKEEKKEAIADQTDYQSTTENKLTISHVVYNPVKGNIIPLEEVQDEVFSSGIMGKGFGIIPSEGIVYAPFDGKVEMVFKTKHVVGISDSKGMIYLVHVGINTVELGGKFFTAEVADGDMMKKGQPLLTFDMEEIGKAGYDMTVTVLIDPSQTVNEKKLERTGAMEAGEKVMVVS
ncbi:MAG: glucose PTS transporter subunit IIA [Lachnospiraceae bacterium]|nr:glucose PTS transporter subunit IIA [Lachnospiraceae bacterium]